MKDRKEKLLDLVDNWIESIASDFDHIIILEGTPEKLMCYIEIYQPYNPVDKGNLRSKPGQSFNFKILTDPWQSLC